MRKNSPHTFLEEVASIPGSNKINECIQCGVCSGSCATAAYWEHPPRKIIAMVRADMRDDVLSSNSIWFCVSCYLCTAHCPRDIRPANIMHALESLALKEGYKPPTHSPDMYQSLVSSIKRNGRVHEFGFMFKYYLKTNPLAAIKMFPLAIDLLTHGRMPLMPKKVKGKDEIKAILAKVTAGGAQ